jgi:hypothetical protein
MLRAPAWPTQRCPKSRKCGVNLPLNGPVAGPGAPKLMPVCTPTPSFALPLTLPILPHLPRAVLPGEGSDNQPWFGIMSQDNVEEDGNAVTPRNPADDTLVSNYETSVSHQHAYILHCNPSTYRRRFSSSLSLSLHVG